jgi:hypothetical protein
MTAPISFPGQAITPLGAARMQAGIVPDIDVVDTVGTIYHLQGGQSPSLSCQDGFGLIDMEGMQAPFSLLDEQGARQDGITNLDTVFDPAIIKMTLEASGTTYASFRRAVRMWISSWNPPNVLTLSVFTQQLGQWWMPVRQSKPIPDALQQDPTLHRRFAFKWECRGDNAFWQGIDSTSVFPAPGVTLSDGTVNGWCPLTNFGTRPAWPRFLCIAGNTGGVTFTLGNGAVPTAQGTISNSGSPVTFGPLEAGQIAAIYTQPRLRSVVDLSPTQPAQSLTQFQTFIQDMVNAAVGNYPVPPELQALESAFGILPPNGPMYSLLNGRFTSLSQLPPKQDGYMPVTTYIPVSITNGNSGSSIVAASTPYRTWPW